MASMLTAKSTASKPGLGRQLFNGLEFALPFVIVTGIWQLLAASG